MHADLLPTERTSGCDFLIEFMLTARTANVVRAWLRPLQSLRQRVARNIANQH